VQAGPREMERLQPETRLRALEQVAVGAGATEIARDAHDVGVRIAEGRFYVAVVGQFKRGKSTLLNALIGDAVLPTGVVPVTSAITVVRHGNARAVRVWYHDGRSEAVAPSDIGAYVSEAENPENRKGVRAVEVFASSPLLSGGMCLVDTPGLGSVFGGNTAVTWAFLPHIDAAIVVVGADPPISGDEIRLVEECAEHVRHLVFVINKADRLSEHERDEGARFATQVLSTRLRRPVGTIFQVSATERLERGATRDWGAFERALTSLAHESGADLVRSAEARSFERLARALLRELDEHREALSRPIEESERRLTSLRRSVSGAERALEDVGVLLASEQGRLARGFRERQEAYLPGAQRQARAELSALVSALDAPRWKLRARAFESAQGVARRGAERFRAELEPVAEETYRRSMERFVELANEFLDRLRTSGEPGLDTLPAALGAETGFRVPSRVYYTEMLDRTMSPIGSMLDAVRSRDRAVRAVVRRTGSYLDALIEANSSRIANDLAERVGRSRERLEAELRALLHQVTGVAERAMSRARARRAEGDRAVMNELEQIASLRSQVESLLNSKGEAQ
jgi:GTP-binding protein EngB required for normal cell division